MRPLIGISCSYDQKEGRYFLNEAYVEAVIGAGGIPVILPGAGSVKTVTPYFEAVKGLILAGGGDVDPAYFNEEPHPSLGEITPDRDRFEMILIKAALRRNIPVLGICRGIQILNIACGGTVIQHIPSEIRKPLKHSQSAPRWYPTHRVLLDKASRLSQIMTTTTIRVNSFHHQAIRDPAPGFKIVATSRDGVIEAIEHSKHRFVVGVQWHPECLTEKDRKSRLLFKAFIEATSSK
ncbi:MAG: gamma-glutamyl-gamma-aminobutyrate hydrolase family protein [Eubacteriales bacterium]